MYVRVFLRSLTHYFLAVLKLPTFKFNLRHHVHSTDKFIHSQNSLPFTLAGLFTLSSLLILSSFSPVIPLSTFMVISRQTQSQCAPDAPLSLALHPPLPHPAACHCSLLCSIQTHGIAISACFSVHVSPTLHTVYFVFLFLIPYQVKNK